MPLNPSQRGEALNNPQQRANEINDPQFQNQQGYFPYDLTHQELISPLFGEITPTMHLDTIPGDRIVYRENMKTIRNQINGNLLSTVNQYVDSYFVSLRALFPHNYEKLIPNPIKGQDLPNAALPQVPISTFVHDYLFGLTEYTVNSGGEHYLTISIREIMNNSLIFESTESTLLSSVKLSRLLLLSTVFSRGQLLDYLGYCIDDSSDLGSSFQEKIDNFQNALYRSLHLDGLTSVVLHEFDTSSLVADVCDTQLSTTRYIVTNLSEYRSAVSDAFERGQMLIFPLDVDSDELSELDLYCEDLINSFGDIFQLAIDANSYLDVINSESNPFNVGHMNISKVLAYQLIVAQYFSNDSVDNIFNSDLFMQLLRAVMFPSEDGYSSEPTFTYNGVTTEYDYISAGAFYSSLINTRQSGHLNRQYVWLTMMMLKRRSLRYGDYFGTARPRMLAVGSENTFIDVVGGKVSPVDVTQNLLKQRYLNAANYIGSGFLPYMASMHGVTPSDQGCIPRYISHRKIVLNNQLTNNTSDEQGKQSTNLVGFSNDLGYDVFIDDFGILLSVTSFDVLPVYVSGIDPCYHLSDRFDYFNPMLQNIGDQQIRLSEFIGDPSLRENVFGWTMRNAEYKFKTSRAHGAFVKDTELAGFLVKYQYAAFVAGDNGQLSSLKINSDFIRDKPSYLDPVLNQQTGVSPAQYWHFLVSCNNEVQCARKIQATPPVLF